MKHKINIVLTIIISSLLCSCREEKVRDVQYYLDNPEIMKAKLEECKNNPGELMRTPNCQNVMIAQNKKVLNTEGSEMPKIKVPDKWW